MNLTIAALVLASVFKVGHDTTEYFEDTGDQRTIRMEGREILKDGTTDTRDAHFEIRTIGWVLEQSKDQTYGVDNRAELVAAEGRTALGYAEYNGFRFGMQVDGEAYIGVDGVYNESFKPDQGIVAFAIQGFAGAKAEGGIKSFTGWCEFIVELEARGDAMAGVEGELAGECTFNWAEGKIVYQAAVGVAAPVGAGVDGKVVIDFELLRKNPKAFVDCILTDMLDPLHKVNLVSSWVFPKLAEGARMTRDYMPPVEREVAGVVADVLDILGAGANHGEKVLRRWSRPHPEAAIGYGGSEKNSGRFDETDLAEAVRDAVSDSANTGGLKR